MEKCRKVLAHIILLSYKNTSSTKYSSTVGALSVWCCLVPGSAGWGAVNAVRILPNRIWPSMKRGYLVRSDVNSGRGASVDHGKNRLIHGRYEKLANKEKRDTENRGSRTSTGARKFKSRILYRMRRAFEPPNSLIWPPH